MQRVERTETKERKDSQPEDEPLAVELEIGAWLDLESLGLSSPDKHDEKIISMTWNG